MGNLESRISEDGRRIARVVSGVITFLLFIAVLLYAGFRGYNAYHHDPAQRTKWITRDSVNFPAITFCPLGDVPLQPEECIFEVKEVHTLNCLSAIKQTQFYFEGFTKNCWTFNSDSAIKATSADDELAIALSINSTAYLPGQEPIMGALCIIHNADQPAVLQHESSFAVDVGKVTDVWLKKLEIKHINGTLEEQVVAGQVSAVSVWDSAVANHVDVDFVFTDGPGVYETTEFYTYTVDIWIGEVGGFACLMTFLHQAVMFLIQLGLCVARPNRGGAGKGKRLEDDDKY